MERLAVLALDQEAALAFGQAHAQLEAQLRERSAWLRAANDELAREMARRVESEGRCLELLERLANTREEEQRRMARDVHDQLGQSLTVLRLTVARLRAAAAGDGALKAPLDSLERAAEVMAADLHDFLARLRPPDLAHMTLTHALEHLVGTWSEASGVAAKFETRHSEVPLALDNRVAVYRVIQEALTNVARHACAKNVEVTVLWESSELLLTVVDDGTGFDATATGKGRLGLLGMRERLATLGGSLRFESRPAQGTRLSARVPLDALAVRP
jgi:signal transduction histidine kinase